MNVSEVKTLAQAYTDRYDGELVNRLDDFLRIVESKVNTQLKTGGMATRAQIWTEVNEEYYELPDDFAGMRDIELIPRGSVAIGPNGPNSVAGRSLAYCSPDEMNRRSREGADTYFYSIIANQLQIAPPSDNDLVEIVYYCMVPKLTDADPVNWLSEKHPDCYVFGLCAEISAFAKDGDALTTWDARFKESLQNIQMNDDRERWSGLPMSITVDGMIV